MKKLSWLFLLLVAVLPAMAFRDLETGTFISRDPAGFVDGPNLYSYVVQNPWTDFDPEGLQSANDWRREPSQMHPLPPNGYFLQYQTPGKMDGGWVKAAPNAIPPAPRTVPAAPVPAVQANSGVKPAAQNAVPAVPNNAVVPGTQTPGGNTQRNISNNTGNQLAQETKPIDSTRPQHGTQSHDATSFNEAKAMQAKPDVTDARFNQTLTDVNGVKISNIRPDAQSTRMTSKGPVKDVTEVQSPTQSASFMDRKVQTIRDILGEQAGVVNWKSPTDTQRNP